MNLVKWFFKVKLQSWWDTCARMSDIVTPMSATSAGGQGGWALLDIEQLGLSLSLSSHCGLSTWPSHVASSAGQQTSYVKIKALPQKYKSLRLQLAQCFFCVLLGKRNQDTKERPGECGSWEAILETSYHNYFSNFWSLTCPHNLGCVVL